MAPLSYICRRLTLSFLCHLTLSGRSYGGACTNSMLKVLYDSANEGMESKHVVEEALFDDDDDESQDGHTDIGSSTLGSLDTAGDFVNPTTLKWATMLRRMKDEIADIGYVQTPTISSSRKLDLDKPFSLAPENFDSKTGKKRALLIGCNYKGRKSADLKASHDDIRSMKVSLRSMEGFNLDHDFTFDICSPFCRVNLFLRITLSMSMALRKILIS